MFKLNKELVEDIPKELVKEVPTAMLISDINDMRNLQLLGWDQVDDPNINKVANVADDFVGSHLSNLEQRVALETMWLDR